AIAAWEANQRLIEDGRFGNKQMQLFVSQNIPFTPMYDAWKTDSRQLLPFNDDEARQQVQIIDAKVLSNRKPPYPIAGGLYDALKSSNGNILLADNQQLRTAMQLFLELEGNDIHPAAGVALASLIHAVETEMIDKNAVIMLNITGGGEQRFKSGRKLYDLKPTIIFPTNPNEDEVLEKLEQLWA
ncbi:MAG: cysteate synthase, partial [Bacteroidales bacterium]|nr:cysteate synthase [Bacteroidales bacterium]